MIFPRTATASPTAPTSGCSTTTRISASCWPARATPAKPSPPALSCTSSARWRTPVEQRCPARRQHPHRHPRPQPKRPHNPADAQPALPPALSHNNSSNTATTSTTTTTIRSSHSYSRARTASRTASSRTIRCAGRAASAACPPPRRCSPPAAVTASTGAPQLLAVAS